MNSRRLPNADGFGDANAQRSRRPWPSLQYCSQWVTTADGCVHTDDTTKLSPTSCEFVFTLPTRRDSTVLSRRRRRCVLGISCISPFLRRLMSSCFVARYCPVCPRVRRVIVLTWVVDAFSPNLHQRCIIWQKWTLQILWPKGQSPRSRWNNICWKNTVNTVRVEAYM